ncbi:MAG: cobalamin-dependent protein [Candidatus Aenigmarchaeota archaeon]|nr:cobalamin-dependent protein [Candidatus Aenigmarchaeota archaeon]
MKVLLLNPPFLPKYSRNSRSPAVTKGGTLYYPIWLSYAAGVLEKEGFEVKLMDAPAQGLMLEQTVAMAAEFGPKMVVIDTSTPSIYDDVKTAAKIKQATNAFVVMVGTHVSAMPEETLDLGDGVDAVATHEYDYTLPELARALESGETLKKVKGIAFRSGKGKVTINDPRPMIENLDELPFVTSVYKKHLNVRDYFYSSASYPMVMVITGRGCPFRCFWCNWPQVFHGHNYRLRSAKNVADEFEYIVNNLPEVREVGIEDDTLTADIGRVREICRLLIERGISKKIKWYANVRVNLDLETMRIMKQAGCRLVIPGYESGVQELLDAAHKGITLDQSREFAKNAKAAGLLVHGCFIIGLPGETRETARRTIEFAKELDPDDAQFFPLIVYPGTEAYEWARTNRYITTSDFSKWNTPEGWHNSLISTPSLSKEDVIELVNKAKVEFYLRPAFVFRTLVLMLGSWNETKRVLKAAPIFFSYLVKVFSKDKD